MSPMLQLNTHQTNILNKAHREAVSDIFQRNNNFKNGQWLSSRNSYLIDTTRNIRHDLNAHSVNNVDLSSYISISAPLHCVDGWTYLSRAVSSLIQGDFSTARHLGYYAELRAAISILGTEGIGILGRDHFVIDKNKRCWSLPGNHGTHEILWPVFQYWAKQPSAAKLIGSIVTPYGIKLEDWHTVFASGSTLPAIAEKWLISWGLDLAQLNADHDARNEISYRPFRISSVPPIIPIEISGFIREFWGLFSPSGTSRFDEIDHYLLNKSLQAAYRAVRGTKTYDERVNAAVTTLFKGKESTIINSYERFLATDQDTLVIKEANSRSASNHPRHVYQLLSRASLLLRLATGANADLILSAGIPNSDFNFWWKKLGIDVGLWDIDSEPTSPDELWIDVESSISEINSWETAVKDPSINKMHTENHNARYLWTLTGTERIAMWGLLK